MKFDLFKPIKTNQMKKKTNEVNFETMSLCIGVSDLFKKKGRFDLSVKYDLLVKDKLHLDYKQLAKLTMAFTLENDIELIDAQRETTKSEKDSKTSLCIDWYDMVMKKLRD